MGSVHSFPPTKASKEQASITAPLTSALAALEKGEAVAYALIVVGPSGRSFGYISGPAATRDDLIDLIACTTLLNRDLCEAMNDED